jgi:DNA-binding NarL/FixJ family response regulator
MVRVVLADDSLLVRVAVQHILDAEPEIEVVDVCEDRGSLLASVEANRPDVVLTDIRMPPSHRDEGIEIANLLRDSHPDIGVIVLSQFREGQFVLSLLERGSERRGYLLKDRLADQKQLVYAIETVAAGGSVIDPEVVDSLVAIRSGKQDSPLERLTPREREILGEVAAGKSNGAIAESFVITKRAVERHVGSIFQKLNLPDETEVSRRVKATLVFLTETQTPASRTTPDG